MVVALQPLTRQELEGIHKVREGPCVSFYLPTRRPGPEAVADRAQLVSLVDEAVGGLQAVGFGREQITELLRPVRELASDPMFWQSQGDGLALFLTSGKLLAIRLEVAPPPLVELGGRFLLAPLIPALPPEGRDNAVIRYRELGLGDRSRVVHDPEGVVTAAAEGRVDTLFLVPGTRRWGTFDPVSRRVRSHAVRESGDDDLIDLAVSLTLAHGGTVFATPREAAPNHAPLAAILRD